MNFTRPRARLRSFAAVVAASLTLALGACSGPVGGGQQEDQNKDVLDRIVDAYHAAREVFAERAPQPAGVGG